jgi:hypothetical protein
MIMSGALANYVGTANLFLGSAMLGILVLVPSWFLTDIRYVENMETHTELDNSSLMDDDMPKE